MADTNGIVYTPKDCHFEGDCNGTCPACEAEVRYLEHQLSLLRKAGKAATVMGVAVGMTMVAGCKTSNGNATPTSPQGPGQTNRVETGNNTNPTPTASRTDTSLIKDTRHSGEDPIPMGKIIEDDSVGSPKVDPCDPFPLGKIGPAKPKKKNKKHVSRLGKSDEFIDIRKSDNNFNDVKLKYLLKNWRSKCLNQTL